MIIGQERAVSDLWSAAESAMPRPREDRPGQPVYVIDEPPAGNSTGLREAGLDDVDLLLPACAATHHEELGIDPLERDAAGFRRRTITQIEEGRSWLWAEDGTILFKAEASAWTPQAVQLQQVWVDPQARRQGHGKRGLGRPLPAPARGDPDRHPLRPTGERGRDPSLRVDRHAASRLLPEPPFLT